MPELCSVQGGRIASVAEASVILELADAAGDAVWVAIELESADVIRFRLSRRAPEPRTQTGREPAETLPVRTERDSDRVTLTSDAVRVEVQADPFRWLVSDRRGSVIWAQQDCDLNVRGVHQVPRLSVSPAGSDDPLIVDSFAITSDESFFGYGEKFFAHDKRGHVVRNWNLDAHGVETERAYKNVPFFLSSRGYGLLVNTSAKVTHHVGNPERSTASYVLEVEDEELDYTVFWGPSFKHILKRLAERTGFAPTPPRWVFGLWMSRCYYRDRETVESVAIELRERSIPCDVLVLDAYWMRDAHLCDFVWDEERFPDPAGMIAGLHEQGFRVCLWEAPLVPLGSEMYDEGERKRYFLEHAGGGVYLVETGLVLASHQRPDFVGQGDAGTFDELPAAPPGAVVDFTNPDAVRWYQDKHVGLLAQGVSVFKTDFGEQVPPDAWSPSSGLSGRQIHNVYARLYNEAVADVCRRHNSHGTVWARAAWTGSQRLPVHWGGDPQASFSSMAASLRGGLSAGLSGFAYWGSDIGGFFGPRPSERLFSRWAQLGMLSTLARCHGTTAREPWLYGETAEGVFRRYAHLRYRLLPYLDVQAHVASETGLPVMRPLVLEYQDDPIARRVDTQYLLGDSIMCAPVLDERDHRDVYLPSGRWLDFWTGELLAGPGHISYDAPLDTAPLFVRGGAIIPFGEESTAIGSGRQRIDRLLIVPDPDREAVIELRDPELRASCLVADGRMTIELHGPIDPIELEVGGIDAPTMVTWDGIAVDRAAGPDPVSPRWIYRDGRLFITLPEVTTSTTLTLAGSRCTEPDAGHERTPRRMSP